MEVQEYRKARFLISTDRSRLDLDLIHGFLTDCYWAKGIPREIVARSIENSLCFGVYDEGKQIGFARVISDCATYVYIGDVFVLESHRGKGMGKWFMECIMRHPSLQNLRRWSLVTEDARCDHPRDTWRCSMHTCTSEVCGVTHDRFFLENMK